MRVGRGLILAVAIVATAAAGLSPAVGDVRADDRTAAGGVFYGTELNDPDRSAYLVVVGDTVTGPDGASFVPAVWVDYHAGLCWTDEERRPIVTVGLGNFVTKPSGVEVIDSSVFQQSHCVNNDRIIRTDVPINFRYDPNSDTLKQTVANGGPATLFRICDGTGFGGTGKNRFRSVVVGTDGGDQLKGTAGRDLIDARGGNDHVRAGSGSDIVCVGPGTNTAVAGKGFDVLIGDNGQDTLRGGLGQDLVMGWTHNDTLQGEGGNDILLGNSGVDLLEGGPGNDVLYPEVGIADGGGGASDYCRGFIVSDIFIDCEEIDAS
ncbi:MAG: calcium-binding protein [Acidimicrobiales bacterium]